VTQALLVSNVLLWIAVLVLAGVVVALVRQLGILYERVAPAGALMERRGPAVGEPAPALEAVSFAGGARTVGGATGRAMLLFFLSPTCPVCKTLLPALRSVARAEAGWLDVVLASDGPPTEHAAFIAAERLETFPYVLSGELGMTYQVAKLPYAVLVDGAGVIRAKGLVNSREHLESLFEAHERGVASLQEWARRGVPAQGAGSGGGVPAQGAGSEAGVPALSAGSDQKVIQ
jgi:methylamine dehydrogenase accessory protein MauD